MEQRVHLQPRKFLIVKAYNKKALVKAFSWQSKLRKGSLTAVESTFPAETSTYRLAQLPGTWPGHSGWSTLIIVNQSAETPGPGRSPTNQPS